MDALKIVRESQEKLQDTQKVVEIEKDMQDFQDDITRLENKKEGRRASDAGSVQQSNTDSSCCGGAHLSSLRGFMELKDAVHTKHSRSRSTKLARVVRAFQCSGDRGGARNRRTVHDIRCRRNEPSAITSHTSRVAK